MVRIQSLLLIPDKRFVMSHTGNPALIQIQDAINGILLEANNSTTLQTVTEGQCLTATIHERWEPYTLRTCVIRTIPTGSNVTLCEQLEELLRPLNWYDDVFTCRSCNDGHRCNDHTLNIEDGIHETPDDSSPSTTTTTTTTTPSPTPGPITQLACHRCFGKDCNNGTDPGFIADNRQAVCNIPSQFVDTGNPMLNQIQETINGMVLKTNDVSPFGTFIEGQCLTATIHEPFYTHTLRTCVLRTVPVDSNVILCAQIDAILRPANWYDGVFTCRSCNHSHFCNNHTLSITDGIEEIPTPPTTTIGPTPNPNVQLQCHRCFGKGYCNNGTDPEFIADTRQAVCNIPGLFIDAGNDAMNHLQETISGIILNATTNNTLGTVVEGNCLTATIYEPMDTYTLRTCVLRSIPVGSDVTLCEQIEDVLRTYNLYGGILACRSCNNHRCNDHTLSIGDGIRETPPITNATTVTSPILEVNTTVITTEQLVPSPEFPSAAFSISSSLIVVLISFGSLYSVK
ncbi:hypothetical protein ABEB36_008842 [Hypothenemus hampei]|uniref:Uncharacterized protein n=1 Tax=Hypothenemus hampei TaxID=57062 RepID=A0ABD1EN91_HYPHA